MKVTLTEYECGACGKGLVTKAEPPGIIHKCDDCVERMRQVNDRTLYTDTKRSTGTEGGSR